VPETLYLVDAFSLIFQVFHALPEMTSPSGLPTNALFGFTKDMFFLRNDKKPDFLVVCFDAPGKTFRDEMYADYKANRGPMPDDLQLQIALIQDMLEAMRIPVLALEGYEADDLIATLATAGAAQGTDVFICSSDKDCRQLLSDRIKIFNLRKREVFDANTLQADWGVRPEQVIDYQTLVGDSVDNVPGVEGVGPKTASKYLQDYGTIENLIAHVNDLKGKKKENLQAFLPNLERTRKLVTLDRQVPVPLAWDQWPVRPWNGPKLLELFRTWGFRGFAEQVRATIKDVAVEAASQIVQGSLFSDDSAGASPPKAADWPHEYHLVNTPKDFAAFLKQLQKQTRFAIDLETTSLDAHQADIVGIAICWKPGEAWYLAVRGPAGEPVLDPDETIAQLKPILEDAAVGKLNQNIKYDWQVFKTAGVHMLGIVADSMLADYLLHAGTRNHNLDSLAMDHLGHRNISITELIGKGKNQIRMDQVPTAKVAEYAGEDADVAWRLCEKLEPMLAAVGFKRSEHDARASDGAESLARASSSELFLYDDLEIPLITVLAEMEYAGIRLDMPLLERMSKEMDASLAKLEEAIHALAGCKFNINSVPQLRDILFTQMKFKPIKKTGIGGESSTDQETLEALANQDHPMVELPRKLLEHRKITKLKGTYVDALPALVNPLTGRVHASFNQTVAATGRLSSSEPNLQNIPIRSEMGGQIRQAFLPQEGWRLLTADYSQIELRLLAHFSNDKALQKAFAEELDIHALVAAEIFSVALKDVTETMRRAAKTVNFGVIYGISAPGLAARLNLTVQEGVNFIDAYFTKYPLVQEYQDNLLKACREQGFVQTILGRRRQIEGVRAMTSYRSRNQPEREAINMQIQGSAADLIKVAMLNIQRRLKSERLEARMLLQIHDELVFETPAEDEKALVKLVHDEMTRALAERLQVPLRVDMSVGANWMDTCEVVP
jgi:DNA polymerase I